MKQVKEFQPVFLFSIGAKTIKVAINPRSTKKDIVSPGHVFPCS